MLTKQTIISIILLPFAFLATWLLFQWLEMPQTIPAQANQSDAYAVQVLSVRMTVEGKPKDQLSSPLVVHYPQHDTYDITAPRLIVFPEIGTPWYMYADKGQARDNVKVIDLWNNVRIERAGGPFNQAMKMTTQGLTIYPNEQYAETRLPVTIEQPGGAVHAVGMNANLKTDTLNLISQTRGQYDKARTTTILK